MQAVLVGQIAKGGPSETRQGRAAKGLQAMRGEQPKLVAAAGSEAAT